LSDPLEEVYEKFMQPEQQPEQVPDPPDDPVVTCPKCGSNDIDVSRGYRGEYKCRNCGQAWQA